MDGLLLMWLQGTIGWIIIIAFFVVVWKVFYSMPKRLIEMERRIRKLERNQKEK